MNEWALRAGGYSRFQSKQNYWLRILKRDGNTGDIAGYVVLRYMATCPNECLIQVGREQISQMVHYSVIQTTNILTRVGVRPNAARRDTETNS